MISGEQGEDGRWAVDIELPRTAAMAAGLDTALLAQAEVSRTPNVYEMVGATILALQMRNGLRYIPESEVIQKRVEQKGVADYMASSHLIAGAVAEHFGFRDTAEHHYAQLEGTDLRYFPRNRGSERDPALLQLVIRRSTFKDEDSAISRTLAQEINSPIKAMQAFEFLYKNGDGESFEPYISLLEQYTDKLLQSAPEDYLKGHIPALLRRLTAIHTEIVESELKHPITIPDPTTGRPRQAVPADQFMPKLERVRDLYLKLARHLDSLQPPRDVQQFVEAMERL